MFSNVVLEVKSENFEHLLEHHKEKVGKSYDVEMTADDWKELIVAYKAEVQKRIGTVVPAGSVRAAVWRHRRGVRLAG